MDKHGYRNQQILITYQWVSTNFPLEQMLLTQVLQVMSKVLSCLKAHMRTLLLLQSRTFYHRKMPLREMLVFDIFIIINFYFLFLLGIIIIQSFILSINNFKYFYEIGPNSTITFFPVSLPLVSTSPLRTCNTGMWAGDTFNP